MVSHVFLHWFPVVLVDFPKAFEIGIKSIINFKSPKFLVSKFLPRVRICQRENVLLE